MPLLDHFRPPTGTRAPWASMSTLWVSKVMAHINRLLPSDRYVALAKVHLGPDAEADVAEFEAPGDWPAGGPAGGTALAVAPPVVTIEAAITDEFEVEVRDTVEGMALVGVIEFVSPANKDRPDTRRRLVAKSKAYLDLDIGLILVDVVTTRQANLHNELVADLRGAATALLPDGATYIARYRPIRAFDRWTIEMWPYAAAVGSPLPTVPLAIKGGPLVPIDFDATYTQALADHNL